LQDIRNRLQLRDDQLHITRPKLAKENATLAPRKSPVVFVITPTYPRSTQQPDLVQVSLSLIVTKAHVHWLVIEDSKQETEWIRELLQRTGRPSTYWALKADPKSHCRGISQRNAALRWVLEHADDDDVVYFADDDNSYDPRVFEEVTNIHCACRVIADIPHSIFYACRSVE
jgi:hypothetical protein